MAELHHLQHTIQASRLFAPQTRGVYSFGSGNLPFSSYAGMNTFPIAFPGWDDRIQGDANRQLSPIEKQKLAHLCAWFFGNVQAIGKEFSVLELEVMKHSQETEDEVVDHPLEKLWRNPNPYMGQIFISNLWVLDMYLPGSGKAFLMFCPSVDEAGNVEIDAQGNTVISEIWPVPSHMMSAIGNEQNFIEYFLFSSSAQSKPVPIDPQWICYSRFPNKFDLRDGYSPVESAVTEMRGDGAMAQFNNRFFAENNGAPTTLVTMKQGMNRADFDRIKDEIRADMQTRALLFTRAEDLTIQNIAGTMKDAMFDTLRELNEKIINRSMGIPDGYWDSAANRANADHADDVMLAIAWYIGKILTQDLNAQIVQKHYSGGMADTDTLVAGFHDVRPTNFEQEDAELTRRKEYWTIGELRAADPPDEFLIIKGKKVDVSPDPSILKLLVAEVGKEPPGMQLEQNALPAPKGEQPGQPVARGTAAPATETDEESEDESDTNFKADLSRWQAKAAKRLKAGRSATCGFDSAFIDFQTSQGVYSSLAGAKSVGDLRTIFERAANRTVIEGVRISPELELANALREAVAELKASE